jgi:hypothetical protein
LTECREDAERTSSSNEDLDLVVDQRLLELLEGLDDTLESSSDVGEVGDTSSDDEDLALGVDVSSGDERDWGGKHIREQLKTHGNGKGRATHQRS